MLRPVTDCSMAARMIRSCYLRPTIKILVLYGCCVWNPFWILDFSIVIILFYCFCSVAIVFEVCNIKLKKVSRTHQHSTPVSIFATVSSRCCQALCLAWFVCESCSPCSMQIKRSTAPRFQVLSCSLQACHRNSYRWGNCAC
jgi:hypothetical protein